MEWLLSVVMEFKQEEIEVTLADYMNVITKLILFYFFAGNYIQSPG